MSFTQGVHSRGIAVDLFLQLSNLSYCWSPKSLHRRKVAASRRPFRVISHFSKVAQSRRKISFCVTPIDPNPSAPLFRKWSKVNPRPSGVGVLRQNTWWNDNLTCPEWVFSSGHLEIESRQKSPQNLVLRDPYRSKPIRNTFQKMIQNQSEPVRNGCFA